MKQILIVISMFFLSGCSMTKPSITEYRITTDSLNNSSFKSTCKNKSLKIAQAFSSISLMSVKMDYAQDDSKIFSYSQSQWKESPNHSVTMEIFKKIRDSNLFKNVQISRSTSNNSLILEINIEDFLQYYSNDFKDSTAKVVLSLTLIDSQTNTILATNTFSSTMKTKTLDAYGGVEALNSALSTVLNENVEWLSGVCK